MRKLLGIVYKLSYPLARVYWFITRPTSEGVRCVIQTEDGSQVLLITHTYGNASYSVPGGGINIGESPEAAARRETLEEVGIETRKLEYVTSLLYTKEYRHDTVHIVRATAATTNLKIDTAEIKSADWYSVDNLPENISPVIKPFLPLSEHSSLIDI